MEGLGSKTSFYTSISYTGDVYYLPGDVIDITCPTDISKFPFDTQRCVVYVLAWGTNTEEAGTDEDNTVKNMAYDNNIVPENPTHSPDSTGNKKTRGSKTAKSSVGMTTITV
jgi:hypothetical protein